MKLPILANEVLCNQCVALCCRYFALSIDTPETKRDFEDLRWYLLHEDSQIFVEDGEWYLQVNRKCRALLPDNRCGIYENRPTICRGYNTKACDWHADAYDYDHLFTEPEQIQAFGEEFLKKQRSEKRAAKGKKTKRKSKGTARRGRAVGARLLKPTQAAAGKRSNGRLVKAG